MNTFEAALCEAALMTGLERNADVVHMCTYAPLFAHVEGWQWRPDLIWMDNLRTLRTPNYYVQQLFAQNAGTHVLALTENKRPITGQDGLYASAVFDKPTGQYVVKIANTGADAQTIDMVFQGKKSFSTASATILQASSLTDINTLERPSTVVPHTVTLQPEGNVLSVVLPSRSFYVIRF